MANPIVIASLVAGGIALVVGLLTLGGVVLSLVYAHRRMKAELSAAEMRGFREREHSRNEGIADRAHASQEAAHERAHSAEEAQKQRLMEARKIVYAKLVDDFLATVAMLARMPTIDLAATPNFQQPLLDLGASVNKTWLLSEVGTAFKARELYSRMNETFMRLLVRMAPLQGLKQQIAESARTRDAADAERNRLIQALHDNTNFGGHDRQVEAGLMQSKRVQLELLAKAAAEIANAHQKHVPLAREHAQSLLTELRDLMGLTEDLMLAARIELGLQGDNEVLRQQTADMHQRAQNSVAELLRTLQSEP